MVISFFTMLLRLRRGGIRVVSTGGSTPRAAPSASASGWWHAGGRSPYRAARIPAARRAGWQRVQRCRALHVPEVAVEVRRQPGDLVRLHPREIDLCDLIEGRGLANCLKMHLRRTLDFRAGPWTSAFTRFIPLIAFPPKSAQIRRRRALRSSRFPGFHRGFLARAAQWPGRDPCLGRGVSL